MLGHDAGRGVGRDKLRVDEDRYRFLLENTRDILWTIDLNGKWQFMTRNVENILHIKLEDVLGKTVLDFVAPETVPVLKEMLERRMRGEEVPPYDVVVIDGRGQRVHFEVVTSPIRDRDGKIIGIQGISRNVTERKCAEEAARKSDERFRDLVENTYDWVWEADRDLVITYSNPRVRDYLGYAPDEVTGRSLYDFMTPGLGRKIAAMLADMVKHHRQYGVAEKTLISKGGEPVSFEMTLSLVYGEDGAVEGFRGICRDIRDRKRAEEARRKAYEELEKRVGERTAELKDAKAQAELYLDLMSHDINNMNMVAIGKMEVLRTIVAGDRRASGLLDGAQEMLESSSRLIANVRKLQQAESGSLGRAVTDLCDVLEDVKKKYASVPGRDVSIAIRYLTDGSCLVVANRLIEDVFSNLVDNAIKHSAPDRPTVIDIELSGTREGGVDYYVVTIVDHGPGIPDELKSKLFCRLERGKAKTEGRGLGLYLVKTLVEGFGGRVRVEDRIAGDSGKGTKFVVFLPAASP